MEREYRTHRTREALLPSLWDISKREWKRIFSNKIYPACMLGAPLFCCFFFISLMWNGLPTDLPVAYLDLDHSAQSRNLGRQLDAFSQTRIVMHCASFPEAREAMQRGDIYAFILVPKHFERDVVSGKQPKISFYTNNSFLIAGSLLFRDMKTIATLAAAAAGREQRRARGYTDRQIMAQLQPVAIDTHALGNPLLNYSVYLNNSILPGILQLMVMLVTVFSIGIEIKERTARRWLQMGNHFLSFCLLGKLLPHTIIFFVVGLGMLSLLYAFMQFPIQGGLFPMIMALFLLILSAQGLGIVMIGLLPTLRLGLSLASLFCMLSFSVAGFSFPVSAMYPPIQALSNIFPLRHYYLLYVDQALNGRSFFYSTSHYLALLLFLLLPFFVLRNLKRALLYFEYKP
ncbi:MAG: ABC transporter permease [Dysgonamonadaceae bacterium]|jgi:ABC-2 type transport system permease protein|nr:ABC transporter permease [Dysgonamonadaceae bacterium]